MKTSKTLKMALIGAVALVTGCATIISGTTQSLTIKSTPEDATVTITNRAGEKIHTGASPMTVVLNKGYGYFKPEVYTIRFEKVGYTAKEVSVSGQVSGWYFGNIIFGGIIVGMLIVDPLTGAMFTLAPDKVDEALDAVGASTSRATDTLTVVMAQDVPADLMKHARRLD